MQNNRTDNNYLYFGFIIELTTILEQFRYPTKITVFR
jgi:hypothetical protein